MAITIRNDKILIKAILDNDCYLTEVLGFEPQNIYMVKATDDLLGTSDSKNQLKQQIFIFNAEPESTINTAIHGIVYEIDVSVPVNLSATADEAIEQVIALLDEREICILHELELLDSPTVLPSETSLYQVGVRFVCYVSKYNKIKTKI